MQSIIHADAKKSVLTCGIGAKAKGSEWVRENVLTCGIGAEAKGSEWVREGCKKSSCGLSRGATASMP